jgi:hypothetical protein
MKSKKKKQSKIVVVDEKKNVEHNYAKSKSNPQSAQDTIPFDEVYENGIFRNGETFILIFKIENFDYKILRENEKDSFYSRYQHFLNTLPQSINYQEFIMNYPVDRQSLTNVLIPKPENQHCHRDVYIDYCNVMSNVIETSAEKSCEQVILGAISFTPQTKLDDVNILFKYFKGIQDQALNLPTKVTQLMPEESFEYLHNLCHMADNEPFLLPTNFLQTDVNLKDYIVPSSFKFRNKLIEIGSSYSCVMFVKRYSHECDDEFLTDLLDNTYHIAVSKHLIRIDKTESLKILKRQMEDLEGRLEKRRELNHKRGGSFIPYSLRNREKDLTELQEKLGGSNCDLFSFATYIYISADTEDNLNDLKDYIKQTAARHQVVVDVLTGVPMQEAGWKSVLPFANPTKLKDGSFVGQPFYLPTDEIANFIPFSYLSSINPSGICYGLNSITNTPVVVDRSEGLNGNGFTLGTSGSGKSMITKAEFFAAAMKYTNDEFIIIDPENEYRPLGQSSPNVPFSPFDAEVIKLSPNTNTYVNIFDTDLSYSEDGASAVTMKSDFIMTFCEAAKGFSLTATERSIIDRCVKLVYQEYILTNNKSAIPTLPAFYDILKSQPESEAADIALSLELFVKGSFNIFAHKTNVEYHKHIIIWDIFEMGEQLKTVGLLVLLETLWQRVIENKLKGIRTWVWTDEFSIMFNDNSSEVFRTGDFFEKIYKRIRKHGGIASGATQNISEVTKSKQAMTMLQNSEFLILLAQKDEDLAVLKDMLKLSDAQAKYLDTDEPGKGLIKLGKRIIPFENKIPNNSLMYKICTTKFKDMQENIAHMG